MPLPAYLGSCQALLARLSRAGAAILLATTLFGAAPAQAQSITPRAAPGTLSNHVVECDDKRRAVQLYLPSQYASLPPMPVVYALHGGGLNSRSMSNDAAGIKGAAERHGFIAVFPNGLPPTNQVTDQLNWRDDDLVFIDCLTNIIQGALNTDPRRTYVVGFSAGARLAYRLAADHVTAERIAAIATAAGLAGKKGVVPTNAPWEIVDPNLATVSQIRGRNARVPSPVSALLLQGGLDPKHTVGGGYSPVAGDINFAFVMTVDMFRLANRADLVQSVALPGVPDRCDVKHYTSSLNSRNQVVSIIDPDLGHEWPTQGNWPFMEVAWRFFGLVPTR